MGVRPPTGSHPHGVAGAVTRVLLVVALLALTQLSGNGDSEAMQRWCERHPSAFVC